MSETPPWIPEDISISDIRIGSLKSYPLPDIRRGYVIFGRFYDMGTIRRAVKRRHDSMSPNSSVQLFHQGGFQSEVEQRSINHHKYSINTHTNKLKLIHLIVI